MTLHYVYLMPIPLEITEATAGHSSLSKSTELKISSICIAHHLYIYIYIYMGKTHDNYPLLRSQQTVIYLFLVRWFCGGTVITILYPKLTK